MQDHLACFAKQNRRLADVSLAIIPVPFYRQPIMQDHLACFAQAKQEAGGRAHYIILVPFYRLPHIRILRGCRKRCRRKRL